MDDGSVTAPLERVLLIHDYAGTRGGAELVVQDLRASLRSRGIDARLMASSADPSDAGSAPDYEFRGSTGNFRALRETVNLDAVRVTRRVIRDFAPQVVHLGMILTQASPAILPVVRGRAVLWYVNEYRAVCPKGTRSLPDGRPCSLAVGLSCLREGCFRAHGLAPRLVQLALVRRWRTAVDLVVSPSRAFAGVLERHGVAVDAVVPHGVRVPPLRPRMRAGEPVIGFAGRLIPEKGVSVLIDALAELPSHLSRVRLWVAGDGPIRGGLEDQARRLGLADRVEFLGHLPREEIERRFASISIQVVPSVWAEPYGLVTAEAMARGTPVMATAVGATPELIDDGRTGYLVPPGDAVALGRRLAGVLGDPAGMDLVATAARAAVADSSLGLMTDRLVALYRGMLNPTCRQGRA
jgi:glycosyltransferase involved in cell wall biosynthesis